MLIDLSKLSFNVFVSFALFLVRTHEIWDLYNMVLLLLTIN